MPPNDFNSAKSQCTMDEASEPNRTNRLSKRRKLNIDEAIQGAIGGVFDTPKSQRVEEGSTGNTRSPSVIDLTGSDDEATALAILESMDTPGEESSKSLGHAAVHNGPFRELKCVQIPRASVTGTAFTGWNPPHELWSELSVLLEHSDREGTQYFELNDFTIYRPQRDSKRRMEMSALDRLQVARGVDRLCFSGRLSTANESYYVHGVSFSTLAIDGFGDDECVSLSDKICIQSPWAQSHDVWYRLGRPSSEYRGFHEDFLWLATFVKYFIDFLLDQDNDLTLHRFRSKFTPWIKRQYGQSTEFKAWHRTCGYQQDFGTSVAAYVNYLYKECYSIDDSTTKLLKHSIWCEIDPANLDAIKRQPTNASEATVVTPFAFRCFKDMYFSAHLEEHEPTPEVQAQISLRKQELCLTPWNTAPVSLPRSGIREVRHCDIRQGDVVCIHPNAEDQWKRSKSELWYAYVTVLHRNRLGHTKLDVLWLYEAADTTLGDAYYPFQNELFLSDNCSCGEYGIPLEEVVAKLDVAWFVNEPCTANGYFVRQKFQTVEAEDSYGFVSLTPKDFSCHDSHSSDFALCQGYYKVGQSVLVRPSSKGDTSNLLQPMRIIRFDVDRQRVVLRSFRRASPSDTTAPPNELHESHEEVVLPADRIIRTCEIGQFSTRKEVAQPFNRNGLGDHFYVLKDVTIPSTQTTLQTPPDSDSESNDREIKPTKASIIPASSPLVGLDLYCGGGNFGRGLEEAGIVQMRYAVDWDTSALHSYRANVENPENVQHFLGSVNDYLRQLLLGSTQPEIARIGSINFTSAGSPCPGFSTMQPNKHNEKPKRFASMVASVVAFVDTYSPQYFILENVVPMTHKIVVDGREQNVFSQILASLVALGYQVQQFLGDAWTLGSSQSRSRVFIVASAPGTVPLQPPGSTHGHPPKKEIRRNLGQTTNGLPFGVRRFEPTPFPYISARSATSDLPDIGSSLTQICPRFPDHRTSADESLVTRQRLARVPTHPHGMGLRQAVHIGNVTSGEAYEWVINCKTVRAEPHSKSYSRVKPNGLFPTILTALHLQCGIGGRVLHWEQHRSLSIMETRRAQGFLDHEVIVGVPSQQLKIVGNSVDRKVAFAMGLAIKESWDRTLELQRDMLRGSTSIIKDAVRAGVEVDDDFGHAQNEDQSSAIPRPSAAQIELAKRELEQMRKDASAAILRKLEHRRQERTSNVAEPGSQRWSGASPADAIAIRRLQRELDEALPLHRGPPS